MVKNLKGSQVGLCLIVFDRELQEDEEDDPEELASCNVGHYSDFGYFRQSISTHLDATAYPTLMLHSACEGDWTLEDIPLLERELEEISRAFKQLPAEKILGAFKHTAEYQANATSLYECFHNVDGENLFESLLYLCRVARQHSQPITFM